MDFSLTDEQKEVRDLARRFAVEQLRPAATKIDATGTVPPELERRFHQMGLVAMIIPDEYGGVGHPTRYLDYMMVLEELGWGDGGAAIHLTSGAMSLMAISLIGTEEQKHRLLPRWLGESLFQTAMAATEPNVGSDLYGMRTIARPDPKGGYRLTGQKCFITNAPTAELILAWATVDPNEGPAGIVGFLIPRGSPGLSIDPPYHKLGLRGSGTAALYLDDCYVPPEMVLGGRRSGMIGLTRMLDRSRTAASAVSLGVARAALDYAKQYAKERRTFGRPIIRNQAISHRLVDMAVDLESSRLLVHRAAWLLDRGKDVHVAASMAKIASGAMVRRVTLGALHVTGGAGFIEDNPIPKWYRDAPIFDIWEGAGEMQREMIVSRI